MKFIIYLIFTTFLVFPSSLVSADSPNSKASEVKETGYKLHKINSRLDGLKLALHSYSSDQPSPRGTILMVHGSSFPTKLSFGFKMDGKSWVDHLTSKGFNVYTLDFLGYGESHRYSEMILQNQNGKPLGRGAEVTVDVNLAVDFILKKDKISRLDILGHSWGGAVVANFAATYPNKVNRLVMYAGITLMDPPKDKPESELPAYLLMTPQQRVDSLNSLAPKDIRPLLADEVLNEWREMWLKSDPLSSGKLNVAFPSGPIADLRDLGNNRSFYDPEKIQSNVLIIRGEYDELPTNEQAYNLYTNLINAKTKRYIVIDNGTHVIHLEKNRHQLYDSVAGFLIEQIEKNSY